MTKKRKIPIEEFLYRLDKEVFKNRTTINKLINSLGTVVDLLVEVRKEVRGEK